MRKPPIDEQSLRSAAFETALRAARDAVAAQPRLRDQPRGAAHRSLAHAMRHELFEDARFLYSIVATGDCLRAARDFSGQPALLLDRRSRLLEAIDKAGGGPTFSDVGRALRVTKQTARQMILEAERAGVVEVFPAPHDRRSIRVALTPSGRRGLERRRLPGSDWAFMVLNGFSREQRRTTAEVLGAIRERLRRYENAV